MSRILTQSGGPFRTLEAQFLKFIGPNAITDLTQSISPRMVVTLGGDQCTGKSTLASRLAAHFKGIHMSAGSVFREEAKRRELSVGALSKLALADPSIDVGIEYRLCKHICTGDSRGPLFIEGRQPGVMAKYVHDRFGKKELVRVYLCCSPREQALRFLEREISPEEYALASRTLPHKEYKTLAEVSVDMAKLKLPALVTALEKLISTCTRDEDDATRFRTLYDLPPELDYQNPKIYDLLIDTTMNQPDDTFGQALAGLRRLGVTERLEQEAAPQRPHVAVKSAL